MTWKLHVKSLRTLLKIEPELERADERTLTAYLPIRAEGFDATYYDLQINHLADRYLQKLDGNDDAAVMQSELARLRTHLKVVRPAGCPAIVAFANEAGGLLRLVRLPESVEGRLEIGPPLLMPLELMLEHHPPALVVVVNKEEASIFASILGEVVALDHVQGLDVRHTRSGGTSAASNQRRADNRTRSNLKRAVHVLEAEMRRGEFERIYVAGPEEARAELVRALPRPVASSVAGTLSLAIDGAPGKVAVEIREQMARVNRVTPAA